MQEIGIRSFLNIISFMLMINGDGGFDQTPIGRTSLFLKAISSTYTIQINIFHIMSLSTLNAICSPNDNGLVFFDLITRTE